MRVRIAGAQRAIAAEDAGRYRDACGALPPAGLPDAFLEPVPLALREIVRRYARTHAPFTAEEVAARLGVPARRVVDELEALAADGSLVHGALRPGGSGLEWCDAEVLRRIRRVTLAALRAEVEAVPGDALGRFLPRWHGIDEDGRGGTARLRDVLAPLQGLVLPVDLIERDLLPRRVPRYRPALLDELCAAGEIVWAGAGEGGAASPSTSARMRPCSARRPHRFRRTASCTRSCATCSREAPASSATSRRRSRRPPPRCSRRSGSSSGRAR